MGAPHLTIYNEVSVDGRLDGFAGDPADYYRRALAWPTDAILMGSVTALNFGPQETAGEQRTSLGPPRPSPTPEGFDLPPRHERPLLVVPDSRGRVRNWHHAQAQPWYRSILVLTSASTPPEYLEYLHRRSVETLQAGDDRVDLPAALARLAQDRGVRRVRADAGSALTTHLSSEGLVDEVALLIRPALSRNPAAPTLVGAQRPLPERYASLRLIEAQPSGDSVLLRYAAAPRGR